MGDRKEGRKPDIGLYISRPKGVELDYERDDMGCLWLEKSDNGKWYLKGKVRVGEDRYATVVGFVKDGGPLAKALGIKPKEEQDAGGMPWDEGAGTSSRRRGRDDDDGIPF